MSSPCEQQPVINEILQVVSALKSLPDTLKSMHADFKEALAKQQTQAEEARETRAILQQLRETIQTLHRTEQEQWEEIAEVRKDLGKASQRSGERIEALEKWQAAANGGKPNGLPEQMDTIKEDLYGRRGRAALITGIPYLISLAALILAYFK